MSSLTLWAKNYAKTTKEDILAAAVTEQLGILKKRKGLAGTILTGPLGIEDDRETNIGKTVLG